MANKPNSCKKPSEEAIDVLITISVVARCLARKLQEQLEKGEENANDSSERTP